MARERLVLGAVWRNDPCPESRPVATNRPRNAIPSRRMPRLAIRCPSRKTPPIEWPHLRGQEETVCCYSTPRHFALSDRETNWVGNQCRQSLSGSSAPDRQTVWNRVWRGLLDLVPRASQSLLAPLRDSTELQRCTDLDESGKTVLSRGRLRVADEVTT